jgi:hypothetical protein
MYYAPNSYRHVSCVLCDAMSVGIKEKRLWIVLVISDTRSLTFVAVCIVLLVVSNAYDH